MKKNNFKNQIDENRQNNNNILSTNVTSSNLNDNHDSNPVVLNPTDTGTVPLIHLTLSKDILATIFGFLTPKEIYKAAQACRFFNTASHHPHLYRILKKKLFILTN